MNTCRIAIAGASGRMGRMLMEAVYQAGDCQLVAALDMGDAVFPNTTMPSYAPPIAIDVEAALRSANAECLIDFTRPDGTMRHLEFRQFGNLGELPIVPDGAPYQEMTITDSKESASFAKRGQMVGITRNAILQDDLGLTSELARKLVQAAWKDRNSGV